MIRNTDAPRVEAVHRALILLKVMTREGSVSVTEAAKMLEVNPSTAQRLLATLVGDGFAQQEGTRRYAPGPELLRAGALQVAAPLRTRTRPYLERLFTRVGETVHLATLIGTEIHHLDGIEATTHALRFGLRTGVVLPAHVTSAGKAMLADLPPAEVEARYRIDAEGTGGSRAGADLSRIHQELDKTRRQGIGANFEESEDGVAAFAVSLGVIDGQHAAFSIAMPSARFVTEDAKRLAARLMRTAEEFKTHDLQQRTS